MREQANAQAAGDVFLEILNSYGIEDIFSSPGSEWPPVWESLAKYEAQGRKHPRYWNCRHEALAVSMGLGYTKASGKMSAQLFHSSVGPTQATMALRTAYQELIPMLVASGQTTTIGETGFDPIDPPQFVGSQWLRYLMDVGGPARLMAPFCKWSDSALSMESYPSALQHACRIALAPPQGPAYLCLPFEVLLGQVPEHLIPRATPPAGPTLPDPVLLDRIASILAESRFPLIVTEDAGRDVANVGRLVALAETLGIAVVEAQSAAYLNFPRNHPLHRGFDAKAFLREADAILLLGVRGPWQPPSAAHGSKAKIILADEDVTKAVLPVWGHSADIVITGSLPHVLDGLLERISASVAHSATIQNLVHQRRDSHAAAHQRQWDSWAREARDASSTEPIDVRWAVQALGDALPPEAVVVEEVTSPRPFLFRHLARHVPGSYIGRVTGGLGVGLGSAMGVKVARPRDLVVAFIGDGAFNYNPTLAALGFAQEYDLPILIVVFNNQSYASMRNGLTRHYPEGWAMRTGIHHGANIAPVPRYSDLAAMFGGFGVTVEKPDQIQPALAQSLQAVEEGRLAIMNLVQAPIEARAHE